MFSFPIPTYIHLRDAIVNDQSINASHIGQFIILPSPFTGSPRYMNKKSQDAMTYVRKFGGPDLFITFTCNPEWAEIKNELFPNQKPQDRHDIVSRVFHLKLKVWMNLLKKKYFWVKHFKMLNGRKEHIFSHIFWYGLQIKYVTNLILEKN